MPARTACFSGPEPGSSPPDAPDPRRTLATRGRSVRRSVGSPGCLRASERMHELLRRILGTCTTPECGGQWEEPIRSGRRGAPMDPDELIFHPWAMQGPRDVPTFVGGSGSYVIDDGGRRYLDFSSQLVFTSLGHQHPAIVV